MSTAGLSFITDVVSVVWGKVALSVDLVSLHDINKKVKPIKMPILLLQFDILLMTTLFYFTGCKDSNIKFLTLLNVKFTNYFPEISVI